MKVNLCIVQPDGYPHSLGFVDQARYFRYQLRRQGHDVTIQRNRLDASSLNFVFGSHLGVEPEWLTGHRVVLVNLEQLGEGGACLGEGYVQLLRAHTVVDYDVKNVRAYGDSDTVATVPFLHAPYLVDPDPTPLLDREIDLLHFGSVTPRRRALIERIRAVGVHVHEVFGVYGAQRDALIRNSKAVLNLHAYDTNVFEQTRAQIALSMGVPLVTEHFTGEFTAPTFGPCVSVFLEDEVERWFTEYFLTSTFFEHAARGVARFASLDAITHYYTMMGSVTAAVGWPEHSSPDFPELPEDDEWA